MGMDRPRKLSPKGRVDLADVRNIIQRPEKTLKKQVEVVGGGRYKQRLGQEEASGPEASSGHLAPACYTSPSREGIRDR